MDNGLVEAVGPGGARVVVAHAARSDAGNRRAHNEDSWGAAFPAYLVADGMGGNEAGDVASQAVVNAVSTSLPPGRFTTQARLSAALSRAASEVAALGSGSRAPGSTLTGVALQVSVDHSVVQELLSAGSVTGVEARALPRRNIITRALGAGSAPDVAADIFMVPVHRGDRWLICSDGLPGEVTDALIEMILRHVPDRERAVDELVAQALVAGGKDNVTVVIVDVVEAGPEWGQRSEGDETANDDDTVNGPDSAGGAPRRLSARPLPQALLVEEHHA